ncbi:NADH:flavin oxidoreductase/NADH oxidase [Sneathiella chungangensis]|uniref:NADH:flavin oxidoreductase/NADH oxidase n=1 Tax=Sneathiella chungangensis TaxID=1418234 RepID=A0A845MC08_9PROT|nr:NADH:flavin oxidoreductase/NADH oxidase [Sneathiella chungangensis]MZR20896.1 NADH:flavin oxidoreductase/NADH oxidase [Sneathiella chungangensis]
MATSKLFSPLSIRDMTLKNRVVVAPMHQYSAVDGLPNDWHLMNAGRFAAGGAGLVIIESTKVERRGCGTVGDLGLWRDDQAEAFRRITSFIRSCGSVPAIQLGHSGRKARSERPWEGGRPLLENPGIADWEDWQPIGPSAVGDSPAAIPRPLAREEIPHVIDAWGRAAARADAAGFDMVEIHAAHGFLIHQFLSPKANQRNDDYGGSDTNRMRFAVEVVEAVRANFPANKPVFMRFSAADGAGWEIENSVALAKLVKEKGVDVIDCSSGGIQGAVNTAAIDYGYQVPYAEKIRSEAEIMTMAVGLIVKAHQAEAILQAGQADLIALARELLHNPNWALQAALDLGIDQPFDLVPDQARWWLEKRAQVTRKLTPPDASVR